MDEFLGTFVFSAALILGVWEFDLVPFRSEITGYWEFDHCEEVRGSERCARMNFLERPTYKVIPSAQKVIAKNSSHIEALSNCSVIDRKNWLCDGFGMHDGSWTFPSGSRVEASWKTVWWWRHFFGDQQNQ